MRFTTLPILRAAASALVALGLVAGLAADASAFCRSTTCKGEGCQKDDLGCPASGKPLFWAGKCVGFSLNEKLTSKLPPEQVRGAVTRSFQAWTGVPCPDGGEASIAFARLDDTPCSTTGYNDRAANLNLIVFDDFDFPYRGEDNTLAKTTVTFDAGTGEILDADIEVNAAFNELTTTDKRVVYDLQSIMTHEIGHFIGLAHSPEPDATMNASYETGSTELRSLAPDDIDAVCAAYPPERKASCDPTPRGGVEVCSADAAAEKKCSVDGGPGRAGGALPAVPLALALAALLRSRKAWARR